MGRPREFDLDEAVDTARRLFWKKGYDGTSMSDLLGELKISAPSFYFAFSSKEALFEQIVDSYHQRLVDVTGRALQRGSLSEIVERLLSGYAEIFTESPGSPGCLILNSSLPVREGDRLKVKFARQREEFRLAIRGRIEELRGKKAINGIDADALSRAVVSWLWGLAVEAQAGATSKQLHATIKAAVRMLQCLNEG